MCLDSNSSLSAYFKWPMFLISVLSFCVFASLSLFINHLNKHEIVGRKLAMFIFKLNNSSMRSVNSGENVTN